MDIVVEVVEETEALLDCDMTSINWWSSLTSDISFNFALRPSAERF
jgi:hypothetical protein